ncbi:LCP family protein [Dorea amylophila]|uniref:LCP family protein n=1 Tax=Dorea amylophila TaxID=2981789 RepID=A0ABW8AXJ0_9FIRM
MARNTKRKVRRRGRRKKRGFASWSLGKKIGAVLGGTFLAVAVIGMVILASKMNKLKSVKLNTDKLNISDEVQHEEGYTNVALFGLDSRENDLGKGNRSDTIMIASLNNDTKEVKLVSIYRDTLLELDDGSYNKANAAYAFGGPEGAVSLINRNLDMNIEKYVTVNFNALVDVIDAVGGLDLELTHDEVVHMNNYCVETSKVTGKSYEKIEPEVEGTYHLNGVQAVSYSRIRYTAGGDFKRAERQRLVLQKIADKVQNMSVGTVNKIIDSVFPQISTNFTLAEMIGYAKNLTKYKLGDSIGFPTDNTTDMLNEVGSVVIPDTLSSNVMEVHKFLFGNDGYTVSSTITSVENGIAEKSSDKAKSGSAVDDDEVPSSAGYKSTYSNSTSGTTGSGYGTTTGTTGGYSSGSATGSGTTTGTTGNSYGTTGGNYGTTTGGTTGGTTTGTTSGTTTETTDGTE